VTKITLEYENLFFIRSSDKKRKKFSSLGELKTLYDDETVEFVLIRVNQSKFNHAQKYFVTVKKKTCNVFTKSRKTSFNFKTEKVLDDFFKQYREFINSDFQIIKQPPRTKKFKNKRATQTGKKKFPPGKKGNKDKQKSSLSNYKIFSHDAKKNQVSNKQHKSVIFTGPHSDHTKSVSVVSGLGSVNRRSGKGCDYKYMDGNICNRATARPNDKCDMHN